MYYSSQLIEITTCNGVRTNQWYTFPTSLENLIEHFLLRMQFYTHYRNGKKKNHKYHRTLKLTQGPLLKNK